MLLLLVYIGVSHYFHNIVVRDCEIDQIVYIYICNEASFVYVKRSVDMTMMSISTTNKLSESTDGTNEVVPNVSE